MWWAMDQRVIAHPDSQEDTDVEAHLAIHAANSLKAVLWIQVPSS